MKTLSTKRALFASVLSFLLCVTMLVGSTFAWFTDTATASVNTITAGTLDVSLEMLDNDGKWISAEGKTLQFLVDGKIPAEGTEILWEPGCTYSLPALRVKNEGNLALKYKVAISGLRGDAELAEVIDWYCNESLISESGMAVSEDITLNAKTEGDAFTIKGTMRATAGNAYQGLSLEGISVTVYATQATVEYDSNGNTYDGGAEYAYVSDAAGLSDAVAAGKNIILNSTIALTDELVIKKDLTINGNGNALITARPVKVSANANVTVRNVKFDAPVNSLNNASNLYGSGLSGKLVVDGCSFSGSQWDSIQITPVAGAEIVISNCRFEMKEAAPAGNKTRFIHIEAGYASNSDVKITISNNFFGASTHITEALIDIDYINLAGIDFGGNNTYSDTVADIYVCGPSAARTITKESAYKALGSKLQLVSSTEELSAAITEASSPVIVNVTESGNYELPALSGKEVTVIGTKDVVIDMKNKVNNGAESIGFEGVTVDFGTADYHGFQHTGALTYKDCTITGKQFLYGDNVKFIGCTFVQENVDYNIWTYGAGSVLFKDCTFESKGKSVLIYRESGQSALQTVEFENCKFRASASVAGKAAIEIDSSLVEHGFKVVIDQATADNVSGFANGSVSGNSVWNNKKGTKATVVVNGTTVLSLN